MSGLDPSLIDRAARAIADADALIIGAGAGMGVDSGLPDFRGTQGFWRAYPPFAERGLRFEDVACPTWFRTDPALAWGFYGHRGNLYRATRPHEGFQILRRWADRRPSGGFVVTSNVDDHFARAGFAEDRIVEVHGSIVFRQCLVNCGVGIFPAGDEDVAIDEATFRAMHPWPSCPRCGMLARPNILMFGDSGWDPMRADRQSVHLMAWLEAHARGGASVAIVEMGAGSAVATIRRMCEGFARTFRGTLIRINPREPEVPRGQIGLPGGALETLRLIDAALGE
ncbi:SIR2 family NAD-dependent protein deacylase [Tundrisphaera sp. TA3]|uniref:SIR2 family NAD-dependent protein deacylase n=1 Tax=Tundrisphaera sp. TA3 TaxID=3435775 RepID=UPI003EBE1105